MKLIVGLGNPGKEYEHTRHNVGFDVLDCLSDKLNVSLSQEKFGGIYGSGFVGSEKVILLKPMRYINLSGEVLIQYIQFFKIDLSDILIVHDDLDLAVGSLKIKLNGSSGGHNGLKNVENHLKTNKYTRIKIGISNDKHIDTKDYVLGKMHSEERSILNERITDAVDICCGFIYEESIDKLMTKYNVK